MICDLLLVFNWDSHTLSRFVIVVGPAAMILLTVVASGLAFALRQRTERRFNDEEIQNRGATLLIGMGVRQFFGWITRPAVALAIKSGLPPNAITTLSALLASGAALAIAAGHFGLGGWLFVASGLCDFLDGRVARVTQQSSKGGALLDSVIDRYVDAVILIGLAFYFRNHWGLGLVLAALAGSLLVSYVRARGEALGVSFKNVGLMQRPERVAVLGATILFSPLLEILLAPTDPNPAHRLALIGVAIVAVTTHYTWIERLLHGLSRLNESRVGLTGRSGILRNILSSGAATGLDFLIVFLIVRLLFADPWLATLIGASAGAVVNFTLNRVWTFGSRGTYRKEVSRYIFVSGSSAVLNAGGVALFALLPEVPYPLAWLIVRGAVFAAWNYPLHRDYVFDERDDATPPVSSEEPGRPSVPTDWEPT